MATSLREARLREQYGKLYPGLKPGIWLPAAEVAEHIVAEIRHEGGRSGMLGRLVSENHFEFRGGDIVSRSRRDERREDRG
jgi:hypothetical protein